MKWFLWQKSHEKPVADPRKKARCPRSSSSGSHIGLHCPYLSSKRVSRDFHTVLTDRHLYALSTSCAIPGMQHGYIKQHKSSMPGGVLERKEMLFSCHWKVLSFFKEWAKKYKVKVPCSQCIIRLQNISHRHLEGDMNCSVWTIAITQTQ